MFDFAYTELAVPDSYNRYSEWVDRSMNLPLKYLEGNRSQIRKSINLYYSEFQSALVYAFPYEKREKSLVASYAQAFDGLDYHIEIKKRLTEEANRIGGDFKVIVDSSSVMEKDLAYRAGLGFFGKNSLIIHPRFGSFFFIGAILFSKKLEIEKRNKQLDACGSCRKCIDACPTNAINENRTVDCRKCVSAFTIEAQGTFLPPAGYEKAGYAFGCDICQNVCPFNSMLELKKRNWVSEISNLSDISDDEFNLKFGKTPLARAGRQKLINSLRPILDK